MGEMPVNRRSGSASARRCPAWASAPSAPSPPYGAPASTRSARAGRLETMGAIVPLKDPDNRHAPLIKDVVVRSGRVTLTESFYRQGDGGHDVHQRRDG